MTFRNLLKGVLIVVIAILGVTALKALFEASETTEQIESPRDKPAG